MKILLPTIPLLAALLYRDPTRERLAICAVFALWLPVFAFFLAAQRRGWAARLRQWEAVDVVPLQAVPERTEAPTMDGRGVVGWGEARVATGSD